MKLEGAVDSRTREMLMACMMRDSDELSRRSFLRMMVAGGAAMAAAGTGAAQDDATSGTISLKAPAAKGLHRIMTCNILLDLPEQAGTPYDWAAGRKDVCLRAIRAHGADVICLQEVGHGQYADFVEAFPEYASHGFAGPVSDRNLPRFKAIRNVIFYRRDRYDLPGASGYSLSETPLVDGSGFSKKALGRHVNWVRLREKATGLEFRVLNTHLSLTPDLREKETALIAQETAQYGKGFPQVLCGDLNSQVESKEQRTLQSAGWRDSNSHAAAPSPHLPRRIDFIYLRGGARARATTHAREVDGKFVASDHPFASADVDLAAAL